MSNEPMQIVQAEHYQQLAGFLNAAKSRKAALQAVVDAPFKAIGLAPAIDLGVVVLLFVNDKQGTIDRVALSNTELALGAVKVSAKPFHEIKIPLNAEGNIIAQAIATQEYQITEDWNELFTPALKPVEARRNQVGASIECSMVWPLSIKPGGALIFSFFQPRAFITEEHVEFSRRYAQLVSERLAA